MNREIEKINYFFYLFIFCVPGSLENRHKELTEFTDEMLLPSMEKAFVTKKDELAPL